MKNLILIILVFQAIQGFSQEHQGFSKLYPYNGDTLLRNDLASALHYDTATGNIYFSTVAYAAYPGTGNVVNEFFRCDLEGNVVASKIDSVIGYHTSYQYVTELDGYLYWCGWIFHGYPAPDTANQRAFLAKTDKNLNIIWHQQFSNDYKDGKAVRIYANQETKDLMLLVNEWTSTSSPGFPERPGVSSLLKTDTAGNLIWKREIGPGNYDGAAGMAFINDGYMVGGSTWGWGPYQRKPFLVKTDTAAAEEWHETYLTGLSLATANILLQEQTGDSHSYYIIGEAKETGAAYQTGYVLKSDETGTELWQNIAPSDTLAKGFFGGCLRADDESIVACGTKNNSESLTTGRSGWLVKYNTEGVEVWNQRVTANPRPSDHEYLYNIVPLPDGGFVAAGSSWGLDALGRWSQDGWLVRVDSLGCIDSDCEPLSLNTPRSMESYRVTIYPNPASGSFSLSSSKVLPAGTTLSLYDITGRLLGALPPPSGNTTTYTLEGVSAGMYLVKVNSKEGLLTLKLSVQ